MKTVTVNVTEAHIQWGVPGDECRCPVALAVSEVMPYADRIEVDETDGIAVDNSVLKAPAIVGQFIHKFDFLPADGEVFEPFSFELQVPDSLLYALDEGATR